jgi:hypothetical protein
MADYGTITFKNARESGVIATQLGSGTYDHIGFFGANGPATAVEVGSYQDTTVIVDQDGNADASLGPFGGSGYFQNCKNIGLADTVRISGAPDGPFDVLITEANKFDVNNLNTEPFFSNISSGTLLIQYEASGTSSVNTYNAKLYAYDNGGAITDPPPDVTVVGFEINASGIFNDAAHSGVWHQMHGRDDALLFSDHSSANGYRASNLHLWVAAISVRPNSVGVLDEFDFVFSTQFS